VHDRCRPGGIEWRLRDLVHWTRFTEIVVDAGSDKGIIPCHGFLQIGRRHRHSLIFHDDFLSEIGQLVGGEEEARRYVDKRRRRCPSLAGNRIAVENRPDRPAAIVSVVDPRQRRIQEIIGIPLEVLGIQVAPLNIGIERIVVVGDVLPPRLLVEAFAEHIDQDQVLPIGYPKARRASALEYGAARHPLEMPVIVLAPNGAGFGHVGAEFADLIIKTP
jgi:hypothetical protein